MVVEAALVPIPEEAVSTENVEDTSTGDEVEEENDNNNAGQNMPPQVDPNAPGAVQPQQLNALL